MNHRKSRYSILTSGEFTMFFARDPAQPGVLFMSQIYHWDDVVASRAFAWFALASKLPKKKDGKPRLVLKLPKHVKVDWDNLPPTRVAGAQLNHKKVIYIRG